MKFILHFTALAALHDHHTIPFFLNAFIIYMTDLFRSGSSLLGKLLSLHPSTSFFYEPFQKFNIFKNCHHRFNNSEVSDLIEKNLGGIFKCEDKVLENIKERKKNCNGTKITVIKTIRIHINGILPWLDKFPSSLKVGK